MFKYFLLILTLIVLSTCSHPPTIPTENLELSGIDKDEYIVDRIINYMNPWDRDTYHMRQPLLDVHSLCSGQDFVGYRRCFIDGLKDMEEHLIYTSRDAENIDSLILSLKQEIIYFPYYREIDTLEYPTRDELTGPSKGCYIGYGGVVWRQIDEYEHSEEQIYLSYDERQRDLLISLFPGWIMDKKHTSWGMNGYENIRHSPCIYMTFGPVTGNIIHTVDRPQYTYVFIKTDEGGGSGEFIYSILVYTKYKNTLKHIGDMWSWGAIYPFQYDYNMELKQVKITEFYQNWPFYYEILYENRWNQGKNLIEILYNSIQ